MVMDERLDALNELGDALQRHQREADGKDELDRPANEAAGVRRGFVDAPGFHEPRPSEVDEDDADRQEKEQTTDDIDPDARPFGKCRVDQVDAYVLVDLERIRTAQQYHA